MAQGPEPSMEEILSSIKRIIAEDSDAPAPPRREAAHAFVSEPEGEDDGHEELELNQPVSAPAPEPAPVPPPTLERREALLSTATADASRQALAALSRMVVKPENPAADNTLEGLVRELLRPMLKDWLDANLPGIVQATVDREVARISGRTV